jgi:hypothetical protein
MIADVKLKSFPGVVFVANKIDCRETVRFYDATFALCLERLRLMGVLFCKGLVCFAFVVFQSKTHTFLHASCARVTSLFVWCGSGDLESVVAITNMPWQTDDLDKILLEKRRQLMDDGWFAPSFCDASSTPSSLEPVHAIFGVCALEALLAQQVQTGASYSKALELHAVAGKHLRATGLSIEDRKACAAETTEDKLELLTHVGPKERATALLRTTRNVFLGSRFEVLQTALHRRLKSAADSVRDLCLLYCKQVMRDLKPYWTHDNDIVGGMLGELQAEAMQVSKHACTHLSPESCNLFFPPRRV